MKIFARTIESALPDQIATEIRFTVASARAGGYELISLKHDSEENNELALVKTLKAMKKEGKIDFFANADAFLQGSAEASYLVNKFPEIASIVESEEFFLIIKI